MLLLAGRADDSPRPRPDPAFVSPDLAPHYDRVRDYDLLHTVLRVRFDWDHLAVDGTVVHRLAALRDGLGTLFFDQHRMSFGEVLVNGEPAEWTTAGDTVSVFPPHPLARGEEVEVSLSYRAVKPPEGVYWNLPDAAYPQMPRQIWTQGSENENHFWFPTYDYPNDKATFEEIVTADPQDTVVGNGELVERTPNPDGTVTWHYRMDVPTSTYLLSLVVGEFSVLEGEADGVPILSYVPKGKRALAERSFGRTPWMLHMLADVAGMPYPYPVYRQTTVEAFLWGGMENVAATTLTANTLHEAVDDAIYSSESLVVHELAHMWWGDLLTTKNWPNLWLAEGFATYCETLYWERAYGKDRMEWDLFQDLEAYLQEEGSRRRRPLVTRYYESTLDLFDSVAYQKGGLVLHMLRRELGDDVFFEVLRAYTREHRADVVESMDLRETAARVSGRPLDRFFDQWVYSAGHPDLKADWSYDDASHRVSLDLRQVQTVDALTPLFQAPVDVDLTGPDRTRRVTVQMAGAEQHFRFAVPSQPGMFELDRDECLIKSLKETKPFEAWAAQLRESPAVISRVRAARMLGTTGGDRAVPLLREALLDTSEFWGMRGEAARALADVGTEAARAALLEARSTRDARIREPVARALGRVADAKSVAEVRRIALGDPVADVAAAALDGLAASRPEGTYAVLKSALGRASWRDAVRRAAIRGFASLKDDHALELVLPYIPAGAPMDTRINACRTAAALASDLDPGDARRDAVRRALEDCLEDPRLQVVEAAAGALGRLGDPESLPALERLRAEDVHRYVLADARAAIEAIHDHGASANAAGVNQEVEALRRSAEQLREELKGLESRTRAREK